jgi:glycosyltransferase involved in cell wall biosynthesis
LTSISVVIPVRNGSRTILECIEALKASGPWDELIVVDDASDDDSTKIAEGAGARVVRCGSRTGPAGARNRGAAEASSDVILFVDADVVVPRGTGERLRAAFADPAIAAVQTVYTARCPAKNLVSRYQNFYYYYAFARIREERIAAFATWCAAIRREVFMSAGGFNDRIPDPTVEDEELGYALADAGLSILLEKDLQVTHLASYDLPAFVRRRFRMARAQAKSAWRSVKTRLLLRYVNLRETGTHHSRLVVLAILSMLAGEASLVLLAATRGLGAASVAAALMAACAVPMALACCSPFLGACVNSLGIKSLPAFAILCLLDTIVLGWGVLFGSIEYLTGSRY